MKHALLFPITSLAVAWVSSLAVRGAVVTINPAADAFVTTGPTNNLTANNYGGAGALEISATGLAKGEFQSVLSFDTSSAKAAFDATFGAGTWTVQSVTLQLTATTVNNALFNANSGGSFSLSWMQNDTWVEGSGTPNAPALSGISYASLPSFVNPGADEALGTFSYDGSSSGNLLHTLTTPPGFVSDVLAGNTVTLRASAADSAVSYFFNSRSVAAVANRPLLTITAVPEPGLLGFLVLGGLLGRGRRRTQARVVVPLPSA